MRVGPWHEGVDIFREMTIGQADEEISQVGVGFAAIHFAAADQAGKAGPISATLVMACKQRWRRLNGLVGIDLVFGLS